MTEFTARSAPTAHRRLQALDYLRFTAAIAVLCYHYLFNGINNGKIASLDEYSPAVAVVKYGYLGVDLFFLISGFVVFNSARGKSARQFAVGRAVRLFPAFWVAVLLTSAVTLIWGHVSSLSVTVPQVLLNLTMIPGLLGVASVDGVYWTLIVELEFYALVFLFLLLGKGHRLAQALPWWALTMLAVSIFVPQLTNWPYLGGYCALFAAGALIAEIHRAGVTPMRTLGLAASLGATLRFVVANAREITEAKGVYHSPVVVTVVVALCFAALLAVGWERIQTLNLPGSRTAGALTYPLYLVHAHVGYMALSMFATEKDKWLVYPAVVACMLLVAYVLHRVIERQFQSQWFRLFGATIGVAVGAVESSRLLTGRQPRPL